MTPENGTRHAAHRSTDSGDPSPDATDVAADGDRIPARSPVWLALDRPDADDSPTAPEMTLRMTPGTTVRVAKR